MNRETRPVDAERRENDRERLTRAVGPVAAGLILDLADLATFGPIGLVLGVLVGGCVGYWLSGLYRFEGEARWKWAVGAAIYCTLPFTAVIPLATLIGAAGRYWEPVRVTPVDAEDAIE